MSLDYEKMSWSGEFLAFPGFKQVQTTSVGCSQSPGFRGPKKRGHE